MKKILLLICFFNCFTTVFSQQVDTLFVTNRGTSVAIFSDNLLTVDFGTDDYVYKVDSVVRDMMIFKASYPNVPPTTYIIRTQGDLFTGVIAFQDPLKSNRFDFRKAKKNVELANSAESSSSSLKSQIMKELKESEYMPADIKKRVINENRSSNIGDIEIMKKIWKIYVDNNIHFYKYSTQKNDMIFALNNIYVDEKYTYLKFSFNNPTSIPFEIDFMSFELDEQGRKTKNSAEQQKIFISKTYESLNQIEPESSPYIIYAIELYAFESRDKLSIKVNELGGERTFELEIPGSKINNAERIR